MAEGERPGGLTALAVLNFVFAGLGVIVLLGIWALPTRATAVLEGAGMKDEIPTGLIYLGLIWVLTMIILLIICGVGYIGQKRVLGKVMGNVCALWSIAYSIFELVALMTSFNVGTIMGLVYPVVTLVLLNTVFKDDFPN